MGTTGIDLGAHTSPALHLGRKDPTPEPRGRAAPMKDAQIDDRPEFPAILGRPVR